MQRKKETRQLGDLLRRMDGPVLVLSTKAGLGNYAVGKAIEQALPGHVAVYHLSIEDLVPKKLVERDFDRYRQICSRYPFLLKFIYRVPLSYLQKYLRECVLKDLHLERLRETILSMGVRTLFATNHRAAFWAGALRRRKEINCSLWALLTDYHMNSGWKFLFWNEIDRFLGPIRYQRISSCPAGRYTEIPLPVLKEYHDLSERPGDPHQVLITGGGWGLGRLWNVAVTLHEGCPALTLHVVCGDNEALYRKLSEQFRGDTGIRLYRQVDSLAPLMEQCAAVITKPGAVTMTEAFVARRALFLIRGLPVTEQENALYAIEHFGARRFSMRSFVEWWEL